MTPEPGNARVVRLVDAAAIGVFAMHAAFRLSLRGGDDSWGANLSAHLLVPMSAAFWLVARAMERRLPWRLSGFEIPLVALAAISLIASFGASYRLGALDGAASLCAAILAVPLAVHLFGPERRSSLFSILIAVTAVVVLYGAIQYVQLGDVQESAGARQAIADAGNESELAGRIGAREPWSTFNKISNTFGGFLVLALPFLIGASLDSKSGAVRGAGLLIAAIGAFCLWATGSLGAWIASIGAAIAFAALLAMRRRPEWRARILVASGAAVLVGVLAAGPLAKRSESMALRDVYWDAALRVAKSHPLGVGLNNFEDHYYEHKDERQEEVRHVHNDYLQVLVELGIPGLLAFLGLIGAAAVKSLRPAASEPVGPIGDLRLPVGLGLAFGWLGAFAFQGTFGDPLMMMLLGAAGLGAYFLFAKSASFGDLARIGLIAGLAGAAVHFLVDFDFTDPGFRHFFFLALGALALASRLESPSFAGVAVSAGGAAVLVLILLPLDGLVVPRFLEADDHLAEASVAAAEKRFDEADLHRETAAEANRLDPRPAVERALSEFSRWAASPQETRRAELAIAMLEDAIRRRPRYPTLHARMAEIQEALSRHLKLSAAGIEMAASEALLLEAERHARRAVELYPTSAYHRYLLGRILDESGQEGASEFREALRLSALAVRVPRLRLDGLQTAVATAKTGGTTEQAVAIYSKQRRKRVAAALLAPVEQSIVDAAGESK